jgi:hypothetical protein
VDTVWLLKDKALFDVLAVAVVSAIAFVSAFADWEESQLEATEYNI